MKKFICGLSILMLSMGVVSQTQAQEVRRGWSSRGKDALIGGAGGAVIGGLVGHGAGGALIGGATGAGAGYLIGRHKDRERGFQRPVKTTYYNNGYYNSREYGGYNNRYYHRDRYYHHYRD